MTGRGAWNLAGVGGTKKYKDATKPGPYYYLGTGENANLSDKNEFGVYRAVVAYQRALIRAGAKLKVDGVLGPVTSRELFEYQSTHPECGTPWGGVGPDTSKSLLLPLAKERYMEHSDERIPFEALTGVIKTESLWDAGAVGATDDNDLGLAQINGPAHPDLNKYERTLPIVAFDFVLAYLTNALNQLDGNLRDAIASYNLGIGGARSWIKAGRPDLYKPTAGSAERNVKKYIDNILAG